MRESGATMNGYASTWDPKVGRDAPGDPEENPGNGYHYPPRKIGGKVKSRPRAGVQTVRTWRLDGGTVARLDALADQLNVYHSPLVDHLLRAILDQVERGEYEIRTRPAHNVIDNGR